MNTPTGLFVASHVARDLLQNAALFKTEKLVVWEYVSNGLQYVGPGTSPLVRVSLDSKKKRHAIQHNGRGMDWTGLQNFFVMHGENIDRKAGRPGRGCFGTGKSAAFGIAEVLRITTIRNRKRSKVELRRSKIASMASEDPIPVEILEKELATSSANGTLIEIEGVHLRSLDQAAIIHYIERHLAKWPKNATVFVNNHECEFNEPPVVSEHRFTSDGLNAAPDRVDKKMMSLFLAPNWPHRKPTSMLRLRRRPGPQHHNHQLLRNHLPQHRSGHQRRFVQLSLQSPGSQGSGNQPGAGAARRSPQGDFGLSSNLLVLTR